MSDVLADRLKRFQDGSPPMKTDTSIKGRLDSFKKLAEPLPPVPRDEKEKLATRLAAMTADPKAEKAKIEAADALSKVTKWQIPFLYENHDIVASEYFGEPVKPEKTKSRIENYLNNTKLDKEIAHIYGSRPFAALTPEDEQKIKELESLQSGDTLEGIPKFVADVFSGMGTFAGDVVTKAGLVAKNLSETIQGILSSDIVSGAIGIQANPDASEYHFNMAAEAAREFTATAIGAARRNAKEQGMGDVSSTVLASVLDLGNTLMLAYPAGRAKEALEIAYANTVAKVGLRGGLQKTGEAVGKQTAVAAAANAWNGTMEIFAKEASNQFEGTDVPQAEYSESMKTLGMGTVQMAAGGLLLEGAGMAAGKIAGKLREIAAKADEEVALEMAPKPQEGAKAASKSESAKVVPETLPEPAMAILRAEEAAAKKEFAQAPISDILDISENVPRGTFERTTSERINDLTTLEMNHIISNSEQVELNKLRSGDFGERVAEARKALDAAIADPAQADKVSSLVEALNSARKESRMMAAERGRIRVENERARIERRDSVNKMIKDVRELDTSKIPNEYKTPIESLMEQFTTDNPTKKTLEGLNLIKRDIENGVNPAEFSPKMLARIGELSKKNFRDLSVEELQTVHDAIMGYQHAGRQQVLLMEKGRKIYFDGLEKADPKAFKAGLEEYQNAHPELGVDTARAQFLEQNKGVIQMVSEEIQKAHPVTAEPKYGERTPVEQGIRSAKSVIQWGKASNLGYETMGSVLGGGEDSVLYKVVVKPVDEGETTYFRKRHEYSEPFIDIVKEKNIGTNEWFKERIPVNIEGLPPELTRSDILALAGIKASGGNLSESGFSLKKDWTPGTVYKLGDAELDALFSVLKEDDKAFLDLVYAQGKAGGKDRADVFRRIHGYDMPLEDTYYPFYRIVDESGLLTEEQIIAQRNHRSALPDQGHNIERVESKKPFFIRGIDEDIIDIIDDTARYVGITEAARNAAKVLTNSEVKKDIVRYGGEDFHRQMMDGLKAVSGNKPILNTYERWITKIRSKGIGAVVGFNLKMAAMNRVLNFRSAAAYVPVGDWAKGVSESIAHPFRTHKVLMENSQLYRDIHDLGSWSELTDILSSRDKGVAANIRKAGAQPMKKGVAAQTRDDMWAAVTQAKREMKEGVASKDVQRALGLESETFPKMTPKEQIEGQIKYAEYVAKRIHASPREVYKGNLTREGILGTLASTMMSDRNAVLQTGIRLAQEIHTPGGGKRMAKYLLLGVFGEALAYTAGSAAILGAGEAIASGIAGKEPKKETPREQSVKTISQLVDGIAGNVYGAGDVGYVARKLMTPGNVQISTGQSLVSQFSGEMVDTLEYMKTALSTKNKNIRDRSWISAFDSFLSWSLPLVVGVPYKYGLGTAMGIYKRSQE